MGKITPFLWYDSEAEEAATLYTSLFPNSTILAVNRYGAAGPGVEGSVMTVSFELDGQRFVALNGGPAHPLTEAVSFVVDCATQEEVDRYWTRSPRAAERRASAAGCETSSACRGRSSPHAFPSC
jgi:predicted 3-demethylubiquinone-9 3-methyltransferase (glyoxalase superfamily)